MSLFHGFTDGHGRQIFVLLTSFQTEKIVARFLLGWKLHRRPLLCRPAKVRDGGT